MGPRVVTNVINESFATGERKEGREGGTHTQREEGVNEAYLRLEGHAAGHR